MTLSEVLSKCPKAADKYYKWAGNSLTGLQKLMLGDIPKDIEVEIPEINKEIVEQYAKSMITTQPRNLYDFFDSEKVLVSIYYDEDCAWFSYGVWFNGAYNNEWATGQTRPIVEQAAFIRAFELLEQKLSDGKDS